MREAKRSRARIGSPEASLPMPVPKAPPPFIAKKDEPAPNGASGSGERGGKRRRGRRVREGGSDAERGAERAVVAVAESSRGERSEAVRDAGRDASRGDAADRKRKKRAAARAAPASRGPSSRSTSRCPS